MNSEQIHYFELVYRERKFATAARLVPMSPQGLAKAIHALEKELDATLFESDEATGLLVPTPYADELTEFAAVYNSNMRLLKEAFGRIRGQERHLIRLGCSLGVIGALGAEFLSNFHATNPATTVQYWEMNDGLCDDGLRKGDYDLALAVAPYAPDFEVRELYRCPMYFWVPANDPLAARTSLTIRDFAGYDVAIPGEGFKCYERLKRNASEAGVELGNIFQMSEIFQLYEFAEQGRGLGFSVRHIVELPVFARGESVVALPMEDMGWGFGIERLPAHALGDAEQAFWNWCVAYAKQLELRRGGGASV